MILNRIFYLLMSFHLFLWDTCSGQEFNLLHYISKDIVPCLRNDPELRKCLTREGIKTAKNFAKGVPELGVPPTDPLDLGDINVISENSILNVKFHNARLYGLSNTRIKDIYIDPVKQLGAVHFKGNVILKSVVDMKGQLILIPLNIKGNMTLEMINFDLKLNWNWGIKKRKNVEYTRFMNSTSTLEYEDVNMDIKGIVDFNNVLGQAIERVITDNKRLIVDELGAPARNQIIQHVTKIMNIFFSAVPYDVLLPLHK